MAFPLLAFVLASAAGAGISAIGANMAASKNRKASEEQGRLDREQSDRELGFQESMADPFRQQMHQATDLGALDRMEGSSFTPVSYEGRNDSYVPQFGGGTSYDKSPELLAAIAQLKNSVLGGNTAPAFSQAPGASRPSVLDLLAMGQDPNATPQYGGPAARSIMHPPGDFDANAEDPIYKPNRYRSTVVSQ